MGFGGHGLSRVLLRPGVIATAIALVVAVAAGYFADHQNRAVYREQVRATVAHHLGHVRADLEHKINGNIQLVRGLVAFIATDPDIDQDKFARIASELIGEHSQLRNIAAAPDLVIEMVYPLAGNEAAVGLDLASHPRQRDAALAAMDSGSMVLAGPVDLVQGGHGFIGRFPVFIEDGPAARGRWGLVAAVIDVERLYRDSGLLHGDLPIRIALTGRDADLWDGSVFFGDADVLGQDPVRAEVSLPTGGWRIAAVPREGWQHTPPNATQFRSLISFAVLMAVLPIGVAGYFYDQHRMHIRELERARRQLEHNSLHDCLTGLPNRRFLDERVLKDGAPTVPTALIHIDLDRFKHINDTLGHAAGDAMLVHAANILRDNTPDGDVVARVGGDEFVIAMTAPTSRCTLEALATCITEQMRRPVPHMNHECRFGASIGIALRDDDSAYPAKQLLINSDLALYRAKKKGRNRFEFFDTSLRAEIISNTTLADEILTGLERREFLPYFQPQFDTQTLDIIGVEALARWDHPTRGVLAPDAFLKTADELNVVHLIDRVIMEETLWQSARWAAAGLDIPKKSVNVSAGRLGDAQLIDQLDGLPIRAGELSFELLESVFLDDRNETVARNIERLSELGIAIEIDDFGTGYASIISLLQIKPARLKIERRLVAPIASSASQRKLVASIIDIGKSLGIEVIAEGVETADHIAVLRELGCDGLQGYAFAAPMTSKALIEFAREDRWRGAA